VLDDALPQEQFHSVRADIQHMASNLDTRIEVWPVYEYRWSTDDGSPLIDIARKEGIRIAA